ncbi:MAG TPA: aspartate kinase [Ignavibacteria bacterium]|nr:aspartate kinase [Ignavibacteria bacterium]
MIVMKFGGTSVQDSSAINNLVEIVRSRLHENPVVVCSAISGMTDTLLDLGQIAVNGNFKETEYILESILQRHFLIIEESFKQSEEKQETINKVNVILNQLKETVTGIHLLSELTERSIARILSFGEILSSSIISDILKFNGINSQFTDARDFIKTKGGYRNADPDNNMIEKLVPSYLKQIIGNGQIPVTQGFIGSDKNGNTTVFSRGGSDFTASLIGMALNVKEIEIWTDVNGILSADPRIVRNPMVLNEITFEEASELAFFGAKVLHPSTILPAVKKNIDVRILNSQNPEFKGTLIAKNKKINQLPVKTITYKKNITVLNISSDESLNASLFFKKIFEVFDKYEIAADLITISGINASVSLEENEQLNDIAEELSAFSHVKTDINKSQVCIVGSNLKHIKGIESKVFRELEKYNLSMISQGASLLSFSFVIERDALESVINILHKRFFED